MRHILKKYLSLLVKHTAPLGLFVMLPLLVILYLGHRIITLEYNKHIYELSSKLENNLKDIESEIAPESFMLKLSRGAWYSFKQSDKNQNNYWDYYNKLKHYLKSEPDLYVFDDNGKLITPQNFPLKSRFLANKLWNTIKADYKEREKFVSKYNKQLKSFLGSEFKLGVFLESRNLLLPIIVNSKAGYIYWMNEENNPQKGILLLLWEKPSFKFRLNQIIKRYSNSFSDLFIEDSDGNIELLKKEIFLQKQKNNKFQQYSKAKTLLPLQSFHDKSAINIGASSTTNNNSINDITNSETESINIKYYEEIYLNTVIKELKDNNIDLNGILWKGIKLNNIWLLGGLNSKTIEFQNYHKYFISFIIILFLFIVTIYITTINKSYFISIRLKLIGLFLIAVITPVMGFAFLGYQYVSDMQGNLITEFGNESRNILLNIDREVGKTSNIFREDFKKLVKDFQNFDEDENVRLKIKDSLAKQDLAIIERRKISDASLIKHISNQILFDDISSSIEAFAKCCIDTACFTNHMDSIDPGLKAAMKSPEAGLARFWSNPDKVQYYMVGNLEYFFYWTLEKNKNNEKEYFIIFRMANKILHDRLTHRIKECKINPIEKNYTIIACNDKEEKWIPDKKYTKYLKSIRRKLDYMGKLIETRINIENKEYLVLAIKSENIRDYSFYAIYPYQEIENKLNHTKKYITLWIIIFIIIVVSIGYQLAGTFIYPVNRLEDGIKAIKERNTEFRIEALQNDEFGGVAKSFNNMISGLKEMELAKYIQESLLPKSLPNLKGYELSTTNRMASAIGGDYFDVKMLDEENLCIIIGDVSGHGVASAIIMAIAKAVLYHGFNKTRDLISLFNDLNSVINTYFNKPPVKKMITLFATIINLPTGKAFFLDAGHNFPMKISSNGDITELKMTGFPVGVQKKIRKKNTEEYVIEKGDTIVFYTDGIIEATGKTTEQYGYDRFKESLSKMSKETTNTILKTLFNNYEKWEDGTEPDDDVTLIVLKRLAF